VLGKEEQEGMYKRIPFLRIFLAALLGIFLDANCQPSLQTWTIILAFFFLSTICFFPSTRIVKWKWCWTLGTSMIGILIAIGGISKCPEIQL